MEAKLAEERRSMEAEREAIRQQQEEIRKAELARQAEVERLAAIERQAAEAKVKAEREAAEAARLKALKPEIEKAQAFIECMETDAKDSLERLGNPVWGQAALNAVQNCGASIISMVRSR